MIFWQVKGVQLYSGERLEPHRFLYGVLVYFFEFLSDPSVNRRSKEVDHE